MSRGKPNSSPVVGRVLAGNGVLTRVTMGANVQALRLRTARWGLAADPKDGSRALADLAPWIGLVGAVLCLGAVAVAAVGAPADTAFGRGLLECLIVGVPIAAGVYVL